MKLITNDLIPVYETEQAEKVVDGRELHTFLEVGRDFSNWMKDRIQKYGFIEGEDFSPNLAKTQNGGRPSIEYTMKLDMAKELCMVESNEKGSEARKYFIAVEKRFKSQVFDVGKLSPEMQMFKHMFDAMAKTQIEQAETNRKLVLVENTINTIRETIVQRDDDWRESIKRMFNTAVKNSPNKDYSAMRSESYEILEQRAKCDLSRRLRNMQERFSERGATKTKISGLTRMDVIEEDPKLKEIYTSIVKELSVRSIKLNA